jgi:hypothetical protein
MGAVFVNEARKRLVLRAELATKHDWQDASGRAGRDLHGVTHGCRLGDNSKTHEEWPQASFVVRNAMPYHSLFTESVNELLDLPGGKGGRQMAAGVTHAFGRLGFQVCAASDEDEADSRNLVEQAGRKIAVKFDFKARIDEGQVEGPMFDGVQSADHRISRKHSATETLETA